MKALNSGMGTCHMSNNSLSHRMRSASNNGSNEDENMAWQDEVSSSEQIAVGAADHKCNCHGRDENRSDPMLTSQKPVRKPIRRNTYQAPSPEEPPTATAISLWIWLKNGTGQKDAAYDSDIAYQIQLAMRPKPL